MLKNISWRLVIVLAVIVSALVYILPTINPTWWPYKKINLGLDLQGGMHLVLEVDTDKAIESTIERITQELRTSLKKEHIRHTGVDRVENTRISVGIKTERCDLVKEKIEGENRLRGKIERVLFLGRLSSMEVSTEFGSFKVKNTSLEMEDIEEGDEVTIHFDKSQAIVFPIPEGGLEKELEVE